MRKTKRNINQIYFNVTLTILATFIGAFFALKMTLYQNESKNKSNYVSLLESSVMQDENYLMDIKMIIDSISFKPIQYFHVYKSVKSAGEPLILI
jgi:hypothetical protein